MLSRGTIQSLMLFGSIVSNTGDFSGAAGLQEKKMLNRIVTAFVLSGLLISEPVEADSAKPELVGEATPMEFYIEESKYRRTAVICVGATEGKSTSKARACFSKTNGRHSHIIDGTITTDQRLSSVSRCEDLGYCNGELKVAMYVNDLYSLIRVPVRNDRTLDMPTRGLYSFIHKTKDPVTTLRVVTKNSKGNKLSYEFAIDTQAFIDFTKTFKWPKKIGNSAI